MLICSELYHGIRDIRTCGGSSFISVPLRKGNFCCNLSELSSSALRFKDCLQGARKHTEVRHWRVGVFVCIHTSLSVKKVDSGIMNDPASFAKVNCMSRRDTEDFTKEYEDEIGQMSGRCLDIGSGPGDVVVDFILPKLNSTATVVCSDISESMVIFGNEKYKDNDRLSFIKLDIGTSDLPKDLIEQFDHVTSTYCLHWCQDMRGTFQNVFNLLRPGGTAFLTFLANFPCANAYKELAMVPRYQPYMKDAERYIPFFQHHQWPDKILKPIIKDVGFEVHHCSVREKSYTLDNLDILRNFMMATNPFIDRIPADLKNEYEKDLLKAAAGQCVVFKKSTNDEDRVLLIYYAFLVYLRKPLTKI